MAILPGTAERDEPPLNSPHDQSDWNPPPSLCLIDWQVAQVQQIVTTITGREDDRQVQRSARIILAVKYRTAAGRLTAWGPSFRFLLLCTEGSNKAVAATGTANHPNHAGRLIRSRRIAKESTGPITTIVDTFNVAKISFLV